MRFDDELRADIRDHYDKGREDERLRAGRGRLELWRTQDVLRRWLPGPPARVLDVGGGSGVHAEWLAADGYDVELIDPVPVHVEQAGHIPGVRAREGDARALDAADEWADAVLLLGPVLRELSDVGLEVAALVSVEGPATFMAAIDAQLDDPAKRAVLLRWLRLLETEPTLLGASGHLLGIATRQEQVADEAGPA